MSNSSLISCTKISPNYESRCGTKICKITPHHMAGNMSVESALNFFTNPNIEASANYVIGTDGRIGLCVDENFRAWTSGDYNNDSQAVTIEVANDGGYPDWHVNDKAIESLINLCVDICQRNGIESLNFTGDKYGNLTQHCYFQATTCPGPYLKSKFPYIAEEVNKRLHGVSPVPINNVDVIYSAYTDEWLGTIMNFNDYDYNGYAGWDGKPLTGFKCILSNGSIVYRAHLKDGDWLDWVTDHDESQGGYAGIYGKPIDGIQMYLKGLPNYHVEYRTRLLNGEYLSWISNCGEGDYGYSGLYGNELDRLQIRIIKDYDIEEPVEEDPIEDDNSGEDETVVVINDPVSDGNNDIGDNQTPSDDGSNEPIDVPKEDDTEEESFWEKFIRAIINLFRAIFSKKSE